MRVYVGELSDYVELPEKPIRIVSLAPSVTETLYMLGVWDRVVGVSIYCFKPPEARKKPFVGSYYKVNFERLEELRPDLILTTTGAQRETLRQIHERGFPVYPIPLPTSVAGIIENTLLTGVLVGAEDRARRLTDEMFELIGEVLKGRPKRRLTVYVELQLGGPITVGASSYIDHGIYLAGGLNIFHREKLPYIVPSFRDVAARNPEVIIYEPQPIGKVQRNFMDMVKERRWENLDAVMNGRIIVTPGDYLAHYGPSFILKVLPEINEKLREYAEG